MIVQQTIRKGSGLPNRILLPIRYLLLLMLAIAGITTVRAQQRPVVVNLAMLDGQELTPDNIFRYSIQSPQNSAMQATIRGRLVYRATGMSFSYSFSYTLRPGINLIDPSMVHAQWTYSSPALRELFNDYKKLPTGTYEYCVDVDLVSPGGELVPGAGGSDCLYQKPDDIFLINLVDPENNAKLHEDFPVLSWMVNYPFVSALTYRVRVAEIKDGQNNTAAINRNNPWYQEGNLTGLSVAYPVYAKPLEKFQPYAWTVDAYYKGILLGGAAPWRFTIIDDSVMQGIPRESFFVDIRKENNATIYYAVGKVKIKYQLDELMTDSLHLVLTDKNGKQVKIKEASLKAGLGDNRYDINLKEQVSLKHLGDYKLTISSSDGHSYTLPFRYVNPDFL